MTDCSYPEKKADKSQRHNRFPREMTSEERLQKFSLLQMTCHYPDLGSASDWLKQSSLMARPIRRTTQMGGETSSVWNFCSRSSDVISRGKCRLFFHATIQRANVCKPSQLRKSSVPSTSSHSLLSQSIILFITSS